jgi:predicted transcriptional regulator
LSKTDTINILLAILETANQSIDYADNEKMLTKRRKTMTTHIMYTTLFNHPRLKEYWNALIQKGLLIYDTNVERFRPTEEGRSFLKVYKEMDYDVIKARPPPRRRRTAIINPATTRNILSSKTLKNAPRNAGKLD